MQKWWNRTTEGTFLSYSLFHIGIRIALISRWPKLPWIVPHGSKWILLGQTASRNIDEVNSHTFSQVFDTSATDLIVRAKILHSLKILKIKLETYLNGQDKVIGERIEWNVVASKYIFCSAEGIDFLICSFVVHEETLLLACKSKERRHTRSSCKTRISKLVLEC